MLEQMLGQFDLGPAARLGRWQEDHRAERHCGQHEDEQRSRPVPAGAAQRGRQDGHDREIAADGEQRQRLERCGARQAHPPAILLASPEREQRRRQRDERSTPIKQATSRVGIEVEKRIEVQVVPPGRNQGEHGHADCRPADRRGLAVEVVDQHERAGGRSDPQYGRGGDDPRSGSFAKDDRQQIDDQLHAEHGRDRRINPADTMLALALAAARQAMEDADPDEVAHRLGEDRQAARRGDSRQPGPARG